MAGIITNIGRRFAQRIDINTIRNVATTVPTQVSNATVQGRPQLKRIVWNKSRIGLMLASAGGTFGWIYGANYIVEPELKKDEYGNIFLNKNILTKSQIKKQYVAIVVGISLGASPGVVLWRYGRGRTRADLDRVSVAQMVAVSGSVCGANIGYLLATNDIIKGQYGHIIGFRENYSKSLILPYMATGVVAGMLPGSILAKYAVMLSHAGYYRLATGLGISIGGIAEFIAKYDKIIEKYRDENGEYNVKQIEITSDDKTGLIRGCISGMMYGLIPSTLLLSHPQMPIIIHAFVTGFIFLHISDEISNAPDDPPVVNES